MPTDGKRSIGFCRITMSLSLNATRETSKVDLVQRMGAALDVSARPEVGAAIGQGPLRIDQRPELVGTNQPLLHDRREQGTSAKRESRVFERVEKGYGRAHLRRKPDWMHRPWRQSPRDPPQVKVVSHRSPRSGRHGRVDAVHSEAGQSQLMQCTETCENTIVATIENRKPRDMLLGERPRVQRHDIR